MNYCIHSFRLVAKFIRCCVGAARTNFGLVVALLGGSLPSASAQVSGSNHLANPYFDAVPLVPGELRYLATEPQPVNGWAYAGNAGLATYNSAIRADGSIGFTSPNYAFLQTSSGAHGALEQTVHLPLLGEYALRFAAGGARYLGVGLGGNVSYRVSVLGAGGATLATASLSTVTAQPWHPNVLPLVVTNPGPVTIKFHEVQDTDGTDNVLLLDAVTLTRIYRGLGNGNFDASPLPPGQYAYLSTAPQPAHSWNFTGNAGVATDSSNKVGFATGHPGRYGGGNYGFLQTGAGTPGVIAQVVGIPVSGSFLFEFALAGRKSGTGFGGNARLTASIVGPDGVVRGTTNLTIVSGQLFTPVLVPFLAVQPGLYTVRFQNVQDVSGTDNTVFVDDVRLTLGDLYNLVMVPGTSIDIINSTTSRWHFYEAPTPAPAHMAKLNSSATLETPWGTVGGFAADANNVQNRLFQREFLRVYSAGVPVGSVIRLEFSFTPSGSRFPLNIQVGDSPFIRSIRILDPSPIVADSVRWAVGLSHETVGLSAFNFALFNPANIAGAAITSVTGSGSNWVVTAATGTGTGLLGLNWIATADERPNVPTKFTGQVYDFTPLPLIVDEPASTNVIVGQPATLRVAAVVRDGALITYQWFEGTSQFPQSAVPISGATSDTFTLPATVNTYARTFFARAYNGPGYTRDSLTATVRAVFPPVITMQPISSVVSTGEMAGVRVTVSGTTPFTYQWYRGAAGDSSNPMSGSSSLLTTPALFTNSPFWVRVMNSAGPSHAQTSQVTVVRVATTIRAEPFARRTVVSRPFASPITVTLLDSDAVPIGGEEILCTAPTTGPSAVFEGNRPEYRNQTTSNGRLVTRALTANAFPGRYDILATMRTLTTALAFTNLPAAPLLAVAKSNELVTITWPVEALGYTLEQATSLASPVAWSPLPGTEQIHSLQLSPTNLVGAAFFRLRFAP